MRFKKDVLMSLSIFIVAIFVLSLFAQKPPKLEDRVVALEKTVSYLQTRVTEVNTKLNNLRTAMSATEKKIDGLETWKGEVAGSISTLQDNVTNLQTRVAELEGKPGLGPPDWDSGWQSITPGTVKTLTHNLRGNPDNYVVDLQYENQAGRNAQSYGSSKHWDDSAKKLYFYGVQWFGLNNEVIKVSRLTHDWYGNKIRVCIWKY